MVHSIVDCFINLYKTILTVLQHFSHKGHSELCASLLGYLHNLPSETSCHWANYLDTLSDPGSVSSTQRNLQPCCNLSKSKALLPHCPPTNIRRVYTTFDLVLQTFQNDNQLVKFEILLDVHAQMHTPYICTYQHACTLFRRELKSTVVTRTPFTGLWD